MVGGTPYRRRLGCPEHVAYGEGKIVRIVTAAGALQPTTDGIWRMDGYGTVLSIRNGTAPAAPGRSPC